ncbi:unnamed protein product [Cyclocybe aegerita]|uniref:Reverse transcriptase domain-containing protein n=1 Tax=Cyclocybe aegerita TaxID=1973307 RepID=A0A8S0VYU6_CYCAE|nr:unnamed protein product [Cyclocybe aegerita]
MPTIPRWAIDHGLTFHEHVRYYATKAFTTVQAMRMLGNSTRGLSPKQRRLLYRSCVVPIATYGYRLWYFDGARNKGAMNQLKRMQRKAALWITGAFRTSPTGGLEALAGLIPVHLMLKKLATRAVYRVATLSDTHPLRSMMGEGLLKRAAPHARSAALMTPAVRGKVKSTVMELAQAIGPDLQHASYELIAKARADPLTVLAATDGSVPQSNQYQAASAAIIYKGHRELERTRYVSGRVTAPDAELNAISCAVRLAIKQANCQHIMVFTDSMAAERSTLLCTLVRLLVFTELKVRVGRRKTDNSIDTLRSRAAHSVLDSWSSTFQDPTYRGSEFLELQQPDRRLLQPSYLNGGPWLSTFGHSITEFARLRDTVKDLPGDLEVLTTSIAKATDWVLQAVHHNPLTIDGGDAFLAQMTSFVNAVMATDFSRIRGPGELDNFSLASLLEAETSSKDELTIHPAPVFRPPPPAARGPLDEGVGDVGAPPNVLMQALDDLGRPASPSRIPASKKHKGVNCPVPPPPQKKSKPCHDMDNLWDALHGMYNSASGREYDASVLDELPDEPVREWADFSEHELLSTLKGCSNSSAPGPDHVTWVHLKELLKDKHVLALFIVLANACLRVGHWPRIFKESLSVIVPKPNKPSYAVPKAFRPIVLLITFGKLIKKMIANRIQFDAVKHDIFHPNQLGGIRQRSTEDAGLILTHLVSSLLSTMRFYCSNTFQSDSRSADVGVGQGSALSPVISGLFIALVMKLFYIKAAPLNTTLLSFVDNGTILAQSKQLDDNNVACTKLFHFSRQRDAYNPSLDLGYTPHTGATPLKPKTYWRYLGFYFDHGLTFQEHVRYYATKAFTTMQAMRMLGNSTRGLSPKQRRLLYQSCVVPIATYSYRLWYFDGAGNKGAMNQLKRMQQKAALWITGAFRTSPSRP